LSRIGVAGTEPPLELGGQLGFEDAQGHGSFLNMEED
jgi:hypothetical protein